MSDISGATLRDPAGTRDFGDGVSESPFGQDAGAGGARTFRDATHDLRHQAVDRLRAFADEGKSQVTGSLDGLVEVARDLASKVAGGPLAGYADTAVDALETWAGGMKNKSIEDLIDDTRDFARHQPAVAVGIAVAAGFALSRFLKASA